MGLPAEFADVVVEHDCPDERQGITMHVGPNESIDKVSACLPLGPGEGWMDLTSLVNHTLPNLTPVVVSDDDPSFNDLVCPNIVWANSTQKRNLRLIV